HEEPFVLNLAGKRYSVSYEPGESQTGMFGGNSNWRGPVWFPVNYLIIDALKRYHAFFGDNLKVPFPTESGPPMSLLEVARELESRLVSLFKVSGDEIPAMQDLSRRQPAELWRHNLLFHEYFHAETGQGLGACHQTGWTALVARCLEDLQAM
ncbi:MAG: glucosidase, partial [Candidatus Eremiobacteraeota bacterium]|nr:glucosidase [Candidatus Eremiobacteraeota bacterium]